MTALASTLWLASRSAKILECGGTRQVLQSLAVQGSI